MYTYSVSINGRGCTVRADSENEAIAAAYQIVNYRSFGHADEVNCFKLS
jgi:hypothetical protein